MNSAYALKELPLPVVLSHNSQGVGDVDVADPSKPLEVLVGPVKLSQRDRIDLFWGANDDIIDTYTHSPDAPDTNGIFSLYVNTKWIQPGVTDVRYTYIPYPSEIPEQSPTKKVIVKLALPGGRDPDPATPYENEKLSLPTVSPAGIITSPEGVTVVIDPYENMVEGDALSVFWHGIKIEYPPLTPGQVGRPITVDIDKNIVIEAGDSENIVVRYEIRDVVNNWSRFSLPAYVEVEAGNSSLPAPIAPQAPNMELDLDKLAGRDVQALVLSHPNIAIGDTINFIAERNTAEGIPLEPYTASKVVQSVESFVEFLIPNGQFLPIAQGRARFKYTVVKPSGSVLRSKSLPLIILGQVQQLALPVVPAAVNGLLDPTERNVLAQVPPYHFMADGNDVTLVWMGKTASGATVLHEEVKNLNAADIGKTIEYLIPDEKVSVLAGGSLEVYYTVTTYMKAFFKSPVLRLRVDVDNSVPLPSPVVDGVDVNGILDPATIVLEAVARVSPYPGMATGDKVTLHWDGSSPDGTYATYTVINSGTVNKEVIFRVPKRYVDNNLNGAVQVWYEVLQEGRTSVSAKLQIAVRSTVIPPLPAPYVKEASGNVLDPANATAGATVVIDASAKLKAGDRVFVVWQGPKGYGEKDLIVTEAQAGKALEVVFAASLVIDNAGAFADIVYGVYRPDGSMQRSPDVRVNILSLPVQLPAPYVKEAVDNVLDPANTTAGATVVINASAKLKAGDRVFVVWQGPKGYGEKDLIVAESQAGKTLEVVFAASLVIDNAGAYAGIVYGVYRRDGSMQRSPDVRVDILDLPVQLPAPYVKEASGNVLDPANATAGATVVIDASAKLKVGERVFVVWQGPKGYGEKDLIVAESQAGKTLEVVFAASLVTDNAGEHVSIGYAVYRLDGSMQRSPQIRVEILKNELIFDTSPVTLGGKVYLIPGSPDVLPAFGAGTSVERQASGGQAPYTYSSSNAGVAQVDGNGLTTVRGNGKATISVTDALGQTKHFEATVSGVIHCLGLSGGNLTQISARAAAQGARIPSIDELHEIYSTYGNRWPMGNSHYWSSTVAKNLIGAKWYFVKNLVTGADFKLLHHNASLGVGIR